MAPFCRQPGVVIVQPAYHRADIESALYRVEDEISAGDADAAGDSRAGNYGPKELGAGGEAQGEDAAAQAVHQAVAGRIVGLGAVYLVLVGVVRYFGDDRVRPGPDIGYMAHFDFSLRFPRKSP